MKIFISYGHNDYTELVDRLFDALTAAGHQPWKDDRYEGSSGIAPGQDFTEVIYKAIDDADFVIAFVTRCTQEKFYCRDERQYAYNKKGARFIQIRMDNVEITLGNARSYIDMSDVVDTTGRIHEKLFENSLKAIFAAFRDPVSFAEGGITPWTKIDTHLKVPGSLKYHDFIATLDTGDFVGRQWLINKCKEWAQDATIARRLFVIFGEAGTGKTAFIRHLSRDEELVRSVHVCVYDRPSTRTVRDTLKDLAYVLAHKCETYYHFLKMENLEKLKDMTEDAMFEYLFLEPLKTVEEKYLLIIDGLDELEEAAGLRPLIRIFRQYADRINPNISFLITTRPDETITDLLKTVGKGDALKSITLSKDTNREDLLLYIDQKLRELDRYDTGLAQKILEACDGNFEYLSLLFKEAAEEGLPVSEEMPLPRGLNERYIQYLDRHMETRGINKISKMQRQLLALLCTIREPLPLSLLADITDTDEYDVLDELEVFGSLIHRSDEKDPTVALFTKGFRDFLLSRDCRRYSADSRAGTELLAQYMMENIRQERDLTKRPYLDRNGFVHLLQYAAEEPEEVSGYIKRLAEKDVDIVKRIADALCLDAETTVSPYFDIHKDIRVHSAVISDLKQRHAAAPLHKFVQLYHTAERILPALRLEADLLLWEPSPENIVRSRKLLLQALELGEQAYQATPCYSTRQDLASTCNRLTDLVLDYGTAADLENAAQWAEKSLALDEQNHLEKPCFESRRALSLSCSQMAFLAKQSGTANALAQAKQWMLKVLALDEQNYQENPCFQTRHDLSVAHTNLGDIARQEGTQEALEEAHKHYRNSLTYLEENSAESPCYDSRSSLSLIYDRLADLLRRKGTEEALTQARQWYEKMLELDLRNHQENSCYDSRRKLSISCSRLGDLSYMSRSLAQAEVWFTKALELDAQNHKENPCLESTYGLAIAYDRLGQLAQSKDTPQSRAEAEDWYRKELNLNLWQHAQKPCFDTRQALAITYCSLGELAQKKDDPNAWIAAQEWFCKALELNKENYHLNPCYESRREYSVCCVKLSDLLYAVGSKKAQAESRKYLLKSLELDEENYQFTPCYESRRDLSVAYEKLAYYEELKETKSGYKSAVGWLLKDLELTLHNYEENPCLQSRQDLASVYQRLGLCVGEQNTQKGWKQAESCFLKKKELDEQTLRENPCYENRLELSVTCGRLGYLTERQNTPNAQEAAEGWARKRFALNEENFREKPCPESRCHLTKSCNQLGNILLEKDTPEARDEAEAILKSVLELYPENPEEAPDYETRMDISYTYSSLGNAAQAKGTPDALEEAEEWMKKTAALEEENLREVPCYETRLSLSAAYDALADLTNDPDKAHAWLLKAMVLDEENYREDPCDDCADALWQTYGKLRDLARKRSTPESLAEAEKWDALQKELEE